MKNHIFLFCILIFAFIGLSERPVYGQSSSTPSRSTSFGIYGAVNWNQHSANFRALPGIPTARPNDTASFGDANGIGLTLGGLVDIPVNDWLALSLRLSFATHNAELNAREPQRLGLLNSTGNAALFTDGIIKRGLTPSLSTIAFEPLAALTPIVAVPNLRFFLGLRGGYALQRSFQQQESIDTPTDEQWVFNNGTRVRNPQSGEIPQSLPFNISLLGGIGYDIPLGNIIIAPEVFYAYSLTPVLNDVSWRYNTVRGGISVRYSPEPVEQKLPPDQPKDTNSKDSTGQPTASTSPSTISNTTATNTVPPRDTAKTGYEETKDGKLNASVAAFTVDSTGKELPLVQLKVEQFFAWQMYPLMNYVFFDQNDQQVPDRYRRMTPEQAESFNEKNFQGVNMLRVYYDVLNIVGKRLREIPKAKLQLVGCNNNVGLETGNILLSYKRADNVRRYLIDTWGIDSSRITVQARNLPFKPTMSRDSLGIEENRRVEMYSEVWDILKPVLVSDTIGIPTPPTIRFRMGVKADEGVALSTLKATQGAKTLKIFSVPGKPDSTLDWSPIIDWNTVSDQSAVPKTEESMKFTFEVTDKKGQKVAPEGSVPVEQITIRKKRESGATDKQIAIYRLILFDFNSPAVGQNNANIIRQFILDNLKDGSKVDVTGFTDKLGNPDVNMRLSAGRAKSVADFLRWKDAQWKGVGGTRPIYPNDTPEGRIYSRSVEVRVETPLSAD